jgi:hypothetical protein
MQRSAEKACAVSHRPPRLGQLKNPHELDTVKRLRKVRPWG